MLPIACGNGELEFKRCGGDDEIGQVAPLACQLQIGVEVAEALRDGRGQRVGGKDQQDFVKELCTSGAPNRSIGATHAVLKLRDGDRRDAVGFEDAVTANDVGRGTALTFGVDDL